MVWLPFFLEDSKFISLCQMGAALLEGDGIKGDDG